ncbi:AAA family ATPase, partial [Cohnella lubricantis]
MYIKEARIDGFGALSGETCTFEAPVTVVYGPNEAGKSTLLRFIRSMLYGFANRSQPAERGEPVYGGRHGGRLAIEDQGRLLLLERYGDIAVRRGGAAAVLRDENGLELPVTQAELERRLLGGVSERLFRQLFAVTLDELQELRSLSGDEVGNYLYHAGMAGGAALTAASKSLEAELEKLYKPRGTLPELNQVLERMRVLEAELRRARSGEGPFNEATLELEAIERELREAEAGVPELRQQLALAQGALEAREWWLRQQAISLEEEELASQLEGPLAEPLPEDAAVRWERLQEERQQAERRLREAESQLDELRRLREQLMWDAELLERLPDIEALEDQREAAAARREELAELTSDLRLQDELLASLLARLSPGWGQEELQALAALAEKERARALLAGLAGTERELERVDAELRRVARQLASLANETDVRTAGGAALEAGEMGAGISVMEAGRPAAGLAAYGGFAPSDRPALRQAWHRMEEELQEWERSKLAIELTQSGLSTGQNESSGRAAASRARRSSGYGRSVMRPGLLSAVIAALGAVSAILPAALGLEGAVRTVLFTVAAALLLAAGGVMGAALRPPNGVPGNRRGEGLEAADALDRQRGAQAAKAALASAERSVSLAARELFRRPEEAAAALFSGEAARTTWREAVYRELDRMEEEERSRYAKRETELRRAEGAKEREQLLRERETIAAEQEARQSEWLAWLRERKLPVLSTRDNRL